MTIYYKGFDRIEGRVDAGECKGFLYEEGKTYECERFKLCKEGFHFCKDLVLTFQYYCFSKQKIYAEVEVLGNVEFEMPTKHKGVTDKIKIVKFLSHDEVVRVIDDKNNSGYGNSGYGNSGDENSGSGNGGSGNSGNGNSGYGNSGNGNSGNGNSRYGNSGNDNSGNGNSGYGNSGNGNSGNRNSGNRNSGGGNSGNRNSGGGNSGDGNSGYRNSGNGNSGSGNSGYGNIGHGNSGRWNATNNNSGHFCTEKITKIIVFNKETTVEAYNKCYEPRFLLFKPDSNYKESFIKSWNKSNKEDRIRIIEMVNFDYDVFFELSGIKPETIKNNVNQEV